MIAVIGATGNVGAPLVEQLAAAGQPVRVSTRDPKKPFPAGVEKVVGELDDATVAALLQGATRLFLIVPPGSPAGTGDRILRAAKAARVEHVVKLSSIGASGDSPVGLGLEHREAEKALEASGMAWTMLRPGFFMSNALRWIPQLRAAGVAQNLYGDGAMYPIAPDDIAAVGVAALTGSGHAGKYYELTGEEACSGRQQLEIMSRLWGRSVEVADVSPDDGAAAMRADGAPERVVTGLRQLWVNVRANRAAYHTTTVRGVLGRPPLTFEQWCRRRLPPL